MDVDWCPVPSACVTLVWPLLNLSTHSQTIHCDKTLLPYCTDIILCILAPGTPSAHKNGSLPSALLLCKWNWSVHVYGTKFMTEMDYQGHTCTTMVGEEQTVCVLSCPSSSIANCKTCTYIADNFWLTYVYGSTSVPGTIRVSQGLDLNFRKYPLAKEEIQVHKKNKWRYGGERWSDAVLRSCWLSHCQVLKEDTVVYQLTNCEAKHSVRIATITSENVAVFKYLAVVLTYQICIHDKIKSR